MNHQNKINPDPLIQTSSFPEPLAPGQLSHDFRSAHRALLLPWISLLLGLVFSAVLWHWAAEEQALQIKLNFANQTLEARDALKHHIVHNLELLQGIQAFMHAGERVDRRMFHQYIASLRLSSNYKGVRAVQFGRFIRQHDKATFAAKVRADRSLVPEGYPSFTIKPEGERPSYVVVEYNEPMEGNEAAFGHDQIAEEKRREVMVRARDTGLPAGSAPITLVQDRDKLAGFVVRLPVYETHEALVTIEQRRAAYIGQVTGVFRAQDLVIESISPDMLQKYGVTLEDIGLETSSQPSREVMETMLYKNANSTALRNNDAREKILQSYDFPVAGRQWRLTFTAASVVPLYSSMSLTIFIGALLLTVLMYSMMRGFTAQRARAERLALQMTAHLREHRDLLQQEVEARTADLSHAKDEAEAANRAKSEFLSNMSHELRTPMHAILSFARLGCERTQSEVATSKSAQYFRRIAESGERLMKLLNNLLDLAKLEAGRMEYEFSLHDMRELIEDAIEELAPIAQQKELNIVTDYCAVSHELQCDALRMGQVFRNILGNAIKCTPIGKRITLRTSSSMLPSTDSSSEAVAAIQIEVIDQGIGIPASELEVIFDKFVQSSKTKSGAGGTGLGLAICREIVFHHQGQLNAANHTEGGAMFILSMPLRIIRRHQQRMDHTSAKALQN